MVSSRILQLGADGSWLAWAALIWHLLITMTVHASPTGTFHILFWNCTNPATRLATLTVATFTSGKPFSKILRAPKDDLPWCASLQLECFRGVGLAVSQPQQLWRAPPSLTRAKSNHLGALPGRDTPRWAALQVRRHEPLNLHPHDHAHHVPLQVAKVQYWRIGGLCTPSRLRRPARAD